MLRKISKISLTVILSAITFSCAGSPPKMEHPVKFYTGSPSRQAMCRRTKARMTEYIRQIAQYQQTVDYAPKVLAAIMAADASECIKADAKEFGAMIGLTAEDMRVLLQYQENLLYKCEKWKQ